MIENNINIGDCCGCKACGDICPKDAIKFEKNELGFWYPKTDMHKCIECGLCIKTCPIKDDLKYEFGIKCYGAWSKDDFLREQSTSGGLFSEIAKKWINGSGVGCGAAYDKDLQVRHILIRSVKDLEYLRKSKYVQSDTEGIYSKIKKELDNDKNVLFSGTPCQIVALKKYLPRDYPNLFTVDFICCGVPSPLAYQKYIEMLEEQYNSKIKNIWFKNKALGWHNLGTYIEFSNGRTYFRTGNRDYFMIAYIDDGLTIRESCMNCKFRHVPHYSDITLGDFWGIEDLYPQYNDEKGSSAVILNTQKGIDLFELIKNNLNYFETDIDKIAFGNFTLYKSKKYNSKQNEFFEQLHSMRFDRVMKQYSSYRGKKKIIINLKFYLKQIYRKLVAK